jgi:hypothetical protein
LRWENEQLTRGLRHAEVLVQEREEHVQVLDRALQEAQARKSLIRRGWQILRREGVAGIRQRLGS